MSVTLRQLRAFLEVARHGSFTAAAQNLHVTQSALSVMIRELERELRVRLFDRTTRRVQLTAAGEEFHPLAEKTLEDLEHAVARSRELAEVRRGRVTIAATTLIASILLPRAIADYRSSHPGVQIVLRDGAPPGQIARMVQEGEVDIGIGPTSTRDDALAATPFLVDTLEVACPAGHPLARKVRVTWRDLAGQPLIALSGETAIRQLVEEQLATTGARFQPAYDVVHLATAIGLVDAGLGVAVLPTHARPLARMHHIRFVKLGAPAIRRDICLLTRRDRALSPAAESFRAFLATYVSARGRRDDWLSTAPARKP